MATVNNKIQYQDWLDSKLAEDSFLRRFLSPRAKKTKTLSKGVVGVKRVTFEAISNYSGALTENNYTATYDTYNYDFIKGNKFPIDIMDQADLEAMEMAQEYIHGVVAPAYDTYGFAKLVAGADAGNKETGAITSANAFTTLVGGVKKLADADVAVDGCVCFVDSDTYSKLAQSSEITKTIVTGSNGRMEGLMSYRGMEIHEVTGGRLAAQILIVKPEAVICDDKFENLEFVESSANNSGFGTIVKILATGLVTPLTNGAKGVYVHTAA